MSHPLSSTRVVGYMRVSTEQQAEARTSLELQRTKIQAYALAMDLQLVAVCEDAGLSAKTLARPGLTAALAMLDEGAADGLVVVKLDRLTRSVRDLGELVDHYFCSRFSLLSLADSIDTRTASGRLVLHVLGAVSQWEREATAERTRDALSQLRESGVQLGGEALGWIRSNETDEHGRRLLERVDSEAATIERIFDLREAGRSVREITDALAREGHLTKRGGSWHATTVQRILRRRQGEA